MNSSHQTEASGGNPKTAQGQCKHTLKLPAALKTQAKDDSGKTYWGYSDEDIDNYKQTSILVMQPSVSLAKNIKRNEPVFSLLNREIIESVTAPLYCTPLQQP